MTQKHMHIGIIGSGAVGKAVGQLWVEAGNTVYFGSRNPAKIASEIAALGAHAHAVSLAEAATKGDVIFVALPYDVLDETYKELADTLAGKVVIEASNPWGVSPEGGIASTLKGETAGTHTARLLPKSNVARAFSHVMSELIVSRAKNQPAQWAVAIAADDPETLEVTQQLVRDAGYVPVSVGSLADSAILDPGGEFMPHLYFPYDMEQKLKHHQALNTL